MRRFRQPFVRLMAIAVTATLMLGCEAEPAAEPTNDRSAPTRQAAATTSRQGEESIPELRGMTEARVQRVVDGDTIIVEIGSRTE